MRTGSFVLCGARAGLVDVPAAHIGEIRETYVLVELETLVLDLAHLPQIEHPENVQLVSGHHRRPWPACRLAQQQSSTIIHT